MKAINWAVVTGRLDVEVFDTLDEAAEMAYLAWNHGHESLVCIECDGKTYDIDWVVDYVEAKRAAEPPASPEPPVVCRVEVQSPDGKWAIYRSARSMESARRAADECMELVADERVRLTPVD